ncbi:MAG: glycine--tRNA ligase [Candidatus Dojkabacteria bacterium]|nr:glycine--tRNA ligase [Candidatus Dojkabacteria bacterium]
MNDYSLEDIIALSKRRGFVWPGSDLYGGLANTYDYGPYGVELKENVRKIWWKTFIQDRNDLYGIDSSILLKPDVWEASGHTTSFNETVVEDKVTHRRYRADHLIEDYFKKKGKEVKADGLPLKEMTKIIRDENIKSPDGNEISDAKKTSALFETKIGMIVGEKNQAFLRGEIAQGLFLNYKNIVDAFHPKLPFGIGQVGKAFRNEFTQGQFTFRTLEFDLMEFEYFFDPELDKWERIFDYWREQILDFTLKLGISKDKLRWRSHEPFELSHYSKRTDDLEYKFPFGFKEVFACAYRTDFDLSNHMKHTGKDLQYRRENGDKFVPHVVEPTFGLSRILTAILADAYQEDEINGRKRVFLKLCPIVAPVKTAVFPLQNDDKLQKVAKQIYEELKGKIDGTIEYDESGSIGKRYRRQDEIGTPFCITVDFESLNDKKVTIRDRDTLKQERVEIEKVGEWLQTKLQL